MCCISGWYCDACCPCTLCVHLKLYKLIFLPHFIAHISRVSTDTSICFQSFGVCCLNSCDDAGQPEIKTPLLDLWVAAVTIVAMQWRSCFELHLVISLSQNTTDTGDNSSLGAKVAGLIPEIQLSQGYLLIWRLFILYDSLVPCV